MTEEAILRENVREAESFAAWSTNRTTEAQNLLDEARAKLEAFLKEPDKVPTCLLTSCEIAVFITSEMSDTQPELTQQLFDDVEVALHTCKAIAHNIKEKYPFMRVELRP